MKIAAKNLEFEKAARLRDGINAIQVLHMKNSVSDFSLNDRDYIGFSTEGSLVSFAILQMREGKLVSRDLFKTHSLKNDDEIMSEFFMAYYTNKDDIPPTIYVPPKTDVTLIRKWIKETYGIKTKLVPVTGVDESGNTSNRAVKTDPIIQRHRAAYQMAVHNAEEDIIRRVRERGDIPAMKELQKLLGLEHLPVRIEGFDIAHIGGKFPVASLISFYNGNPDKKNYRYFRLKTTDGVIDDFASMREASSRRYTRLLNEQADMPDLIVIDGGIGQVTAGKGVLSRLGLEIPVIGLAKREEEIF